MVNIVVVFPLHKTVFFQQLDGVKWKSAVMRLRIEGLRHVYRGVVPPLLQRAASASLMFGFQSQAERFLHRHPSTVNMPPSVKIVISATMAGCLEASLTPFERVQTLLLSSSNSTFSRNTSHALYSLFKSYGFKELYRGLTPILLRNSVGNVLYFEGKDCLYHKSHSQDLPFGKRLLTDFLIGGFLGSVIGAILFPLNVAKTQMQSSVGMEFSSLRSTLRGLLNEREHTKISRLYSGLPANFARSMLSWGVITMVYEWLLTL
uniref:Solute carrier family 25 member 51 n=1 Tax=Mesocestoides corti TaxID=53468 RepID=A0A5K3EIH7_MESCO